VHRIGRTGRAGLSGTAITVVAPADQRNVAAIEKLIGQTIPWMGEPPRAETTELAPHEREPRKHGRGGRPSRPHRENAKAPVARLDDARPHRAQRKPAAVPEDSGGAAGDHLPAFLLRPFRVKA
jgi:superfamily II DNA/RNA helicase